jgi:hypothetical protein
MLIDACNLTYLPFVHSRFSPLTKEYERMNHFISKDLYLSSYLNSSGCRLVSHTRVDGITMFSFERTEELERLVEAYFSLDASVNPIKYDEAMKTLRTLAMGPKSRHENTFPPSRVAA